VEGSVYLDVRCQSSYTKLVLTLKGEEKVYWSESDGESSSSYDNQFINYFTELTIKDFEGSVNQGQYKFPFSLLLPAAMTGSFYDSADNCLKYGLQAILTHPTSSNNSQYH
jgi:hypothetical protein